MWANAQRDGRPVEHRWRRLQKFRMYHDAVWLMPTGRVLCSNAANIEERKTWTQSEVCNSQNFVGDKTRENVYSVPAQETAKHCEKFGWPPVNDVAAVTKPRRETR